MANSYFQFKQFRIAQDKAAMKVGTDGVLLGAWTNVPEQGQILDIGTGTGLIALMMAQRSKCQIYALEIDKGAALQAAENVDCSQWAGKIVVVHDNFVNWETEQKFKLIVSNPPFFSNSYKPLTKSRSMARHNEQLTVEDLIMKSSKILARDGKMSFILPSEFEGLVEEEALKNHLFVSRICRIRPVPHKKYHRIMVELSNVPSQAEEDEIVLELGERHQYSQKYINLTREFYLNF